MIGLLDPEMHPINNILGSIQRWRQNGFEVITSTLTSLQSSQKGVKTSSLISIRNGVPVAVRIKRKTLLIFEDYSNPETKESFSVGLLGF